MESVQGKLSEEPQKGVLFEGRETYGNRWKLAGWKDVKTLKIWEKYREDQAVRDAQNSVFGI